MCNKDFDSARRDVHALKQTERERLAANNQTCVAEPGDAAYGGGIADPASGMRVEGALGFGGALKGFSGITRHNRPFSPHQVEMALKLFYMSKIDARPLFPANIEALDRFVSLGLATKIENINETVYVSNHTALSLYVDALLKVPFPEHVWVMPRH